MMSMKRHRHGSHLMALLSAIMISLTIWFLPNAGADSVVPGYVLVRMQPGVDIRALAASYGTTAQDQVSGTDLYSLATPGGTSAQNFAARLAQDTRVLYAEPDQFISFPEVNGEPFHLAIDRTKQPTTYAFSVAYTQVNLGVVDAWQQTNGVKPPATGQGIVVAVLDTGATFTHPDLQAHYLAGYNALSPNLPPVDAADGVTNAEVGHGTMVAGLIARLAPQASILPIRVLNGDGVGTLFELIKGIHYANTHGARVINMSFGCSLSSGALNDALGESEAAGIVLVASAGNNNSNQPLTPAVGRGTIAVGAVEANNTKSPYSNYGSFLRVVAPGSGIRSTFADGGYATWSGTSFAAPFVAAEAALILSVQPGFTAEATVSLIRQTAHSVDSVNPAYKGLLGNGIIDIQAAIIGQSSSGGGGGSGSGSGGGGGKH